MDPLVLLGGAAAPIAAVLSIRRIRSYGRRKSPRTPQPGADPAASLATDGSVVLVAGTDSLRRTYEELRAMPGLRQVRAIWNARYAETEDYFQREGEWLSANPSVQIERIVNTAHLGESQLRSLFELQQAHPNLVLYESHVDHIELFLCEYEVGGFVTYRGVLVVNHLDQHRAELGILLDGAKASRVEAVLPSLREWFLTVRERPIDESRIRGATVWDQSAVHYDREVRPRAESPYLTHFLETEDMMLSQAVLSHRPSSVLEFGCGTGRSLASILAAPWANDLVYYVGLDISEAMLTQARAKRLDLGDHSRRTYFFKIDGRFAQDYLREGRIAIAKSFGDTKQLEAYPLNPLLFEDSTKIVASLLNTIGILEPDDRDPFLRNMFLAASERDIVFISVFAASAFPTYARELYRSIPDIVGIEPNELSDESFDDSSATFRAAEYYSHWFTLEELQTQIDRVGGRIRDTKRIEFRGVDLGYVVECEAVTGGEP